MTSWSSILSRLGTAAMIVFSILIIRITCTSARFCVVIKSTTTCCDNNHSTTTAAIVATVSSFTANDKIVLMRMNIVGTNSTSIISINFSIFKFSTGEFKTKIMTGGVLLRYPHFSPIYIILYYVLLFIINYILSITYYLSHTIHYKLYAIFTHYTLSFISITSITFTISTISTTNYRPLYTIQHTIYYTELYYIKLHQTILHYLLYPYYLIYTLYFIYLISSLLTFIPILYNF